MTNSNFYTALIVDDEILQCKILSQLIQKSRPNLKVFCCYSGQSAIRFLNENTVDVLITDIRMPEMNGLDLIHVAKKMQPQIEIAVVSAYQEFEYAKKALEYGANYYLIKPFSIEEINQVLEILEGKLREQNKKQTLINFANQSRRYLQLEQTGIMLADLFSNKEDITKNLSTSLSYDFGRIGFITIIPKKNIRHSKAIEICLNILEKVFPSWHYFDGRYLTLPPKNEYVLGIILRDKIIQKGKVNYIIQELNDSDIECFFSTSSYKHNIVASLNEAIEESLHSLSYKFYDQDNHIFIYDELAKHIQQSVPTFETSISAKDIFEFNASKTDKMICELKNTYAASKMYLPMLVKKELGNFLLRLKQNINYHLKYLNILDNIDVVYETVISATTLNGAIKAIETFLKNGYSDSLPNKTLTINQILLYMEKNLHRDISLDEIADIAGYSPNYLSYLIKERTGKTFIHYLISIRLERALEMLINTDLSISEIAKSCGYNEASYFIRHFNSKYHCTPDSFRKNIRFYNATNIF